MERTHKALSTVVVWLGMQRFLPLPFTALLDTESSLFLSLTLFLSRYEHAARRTATINSVKR